MKLRHLLLGSGILFSCLLSFALSSQKTMTIESCNQVIVIDSIYKSIKNIDTYLQESKERQQYAIKKYKERHKTDSIHNDSVQSEFELMSKIEENTYVDFYKDGWTFFAILTFLISCGISGFTLKAQRKTERHTKNVSISVQKGQIKDLSRHFYRNLVCTTAMFLKYFHNSNITNIDNDGNHKFKRYPSETNMLKLQTLPEDIYLNIDVTKDEIFKNIHEKKLLLKNYNLEITVASNHFSSKELTKEDIINDIDNLLFKPMFLIKENFSLRDLLKDHKETKDNTNDYIIDVVYEFVKEHFKKLNFNNLTSEEQHNFEVISTDNDFENYMTYGGKNGIVRSCDHLFKNDKNTNIKFLSWDNNGTCKIDIKKFISYFKIYISNSVDQGHKNLKDNIDNILTNSDFDVFYKNANINPKFKNLVKKHFDFWHKNGEIEIKLFIYNILILDAILELPKIGMINHH